MAIRHSHLFSILHREGVSKSPISAETTLILLLVWTAKAKTRNILLSRSIDRLLSRFWQLSNCETSVLIISGKLGGVSQGSVKRWGQLRKGTKILLEDKKICALIEIPSLQDLELLYFLSCPGARATQKVALHYNPISWLSFQDTVWLALDFLQYLSFLFSLARGQRAWPLSPSLTFHK